MRKTLLAASALAPFCLIVGLESAAAQTTVTSSTSTPITTAQDGDIVINTGVTIQPTQPNTAAVTINSSNSVGANGEIQYENLNNVVGVLIQGGNTGSFANAGTIAVTENNFTRPLINDIASGPFASPTSTSRYGVQLVGTQPFVGDINNTGTIQVEGNNSYGISLEAPLTGNVETSGTLQLNGNNGSGLRETAGVSGNVLISGAVSVQGANSTGVSLARPVGGRVSVYSTISTTDYSVTTRPYAGTSLQTIQATPTEVAADAGSALVIGGGAAQGVLLAAPPQYTNTSDPNTDADGDGVVDAAEGTSTVVTYGAAPALVLGGTAASTFGDFVAATASNPNNAYSVILEGTVEGLGVFDNVSPVAVQIGGFGAPTTLLGGLKVAPNATVQAIAYGSANPVGVFIGKGAVVPLLDNGGTITASILTPNSTSSSIPAFTGLATAVSIDSGGTLSRLTNSGVISATLTGDANDTARAIAVVDRGGQLGSVVNTGTINASFTPDAVGAIVTGAPITLANGQTAASGAVALDLSNNTAGVTLTQQQAPNTVVTTVTTNNVPTVTVTQTPAATGTLLITTAPTITTVTNGGTSVETIVPASPTITGDIYLGNGPNTVNLLAGTVAGALSMGSGPTANVLVDQGAIYAGAFTYSGTSGAGLTLNVNNGIFDNTSASTYRTANLTVGSSGVLYIGVDPVNNRAAFYNVSGTATIAAGGKLGLVVTSLASGPQTYTVVAANQLNVSGQTGAAILGPVPYIFDAAFTTNPAQGLITVTIAPKTAAELGLNPSQSAALGPTYQAIARDAPVQSAFLNQYSKQGFFGVYNQILPDYAGGTFQAANAASEAIGRATSEANEIENPTGTRGAWAEEVVVGVNQGAGKTDGFRGGGFGFVGGLETGGFGLGAFGVTTAFINTTVVDPHVPGDSQTAMTELEFGGYWQGEFGGLLADARIGGGYLWMTGRRQFIQTNSLDQITVSRQVDDTWNGYTASARFGLAYTLDFGAKFLGGGWFVRPQTHLDAFMLNQSGFNESLLQGGPALAMGFNSVNGHEASGTASLLIGRKLGQGLVFRPELELGVRDVFTGTAGDLTAHYLSGGPNFTLTPADIVGPAAMARFKLKASTEYYELGFETGGEIRSSRYEELDVKASVRVLF